MSRNASRITCKFIALAVVSAGFLLAVTGPLSGADVKQQPSAQLVSLGFKFEGAAGCSNANCHGSPTAKAAPKPAANEYVTWSEKDKHAEAHKTLTKPESAKITQAMGLNEAPADSPLCTNCHGLTVPANLQMAKFNVKEGVTCGACHGPYEKWEKPHNVEGGANGLRKAAGYAVLKAEEMPYHTGSPEHAKLLKETGLYDTRPILARAEKCTSCHLAIDAKMIDAGHPQPIFELAYYTGLENPHWREPGGYWATKVWAAGQVICLRDAMTQLADRAADASTSAKTLKDAYDQAMGHLGVFKHAAGPAAAAALDGPGKDLKAAANDKAKMATAAKSIADAASKMTAGVGAFKPGEGNTAGLLAKIVGDADVVKDAGMRGAEQQSLALSTLLSSFVSGKGAVAGADDVKKLIDEKLLGSLDPATFKADDFSASLKAVAAKLTPMLPSGGGVPDPIDLK